MLNMFSQLQAMTGCVVEDEPEQATPEPVANKYAEMIGTPVASKKGKFGYGHGRNHNFKPGQEPILEELKKQSMDRYDLAKALNCPVENLRSGLSNVVFRELAVRSEDDGVYTITEKGRKWRMGQRSQRFSIKP